MYSTRTWLLTIISTQLGHVQCVCGPCAERLSLPIQYNKERTMSRRTFSLRWLSGLLILFKRRDMDGGRCCTVCRTDGVSRGEQVSCVISPAVLAANSSVSNFFSQFATRWWLVYLGARHPPLSMTGDYHEATKAIVDYFVKDMLLQNTTTTALMFMWTLPQPQLIHPNCSVRPRQLQRGP